VLLVMLLSAGACSTAEEPGGLETTGPVVGVIEASIQGIRDVATAAGQVVPAAGTDWTIYAPEPAMIAELPKALGDPVAAGDLLVRFEVGSHAQTFAVRQATLSDATARADAARAELSRLTPLFERGIVPRNDVETARAELAAADAARATAEAYLEEAPPARGRPRRAFRA
jgi:cobalt-zinc-cadmium efflux system membrane fusion protein